MIAPVITRWRNLVDPDGREWHPESWGDVFAELTSRARFLGDKEHPGWSPARFDPCTRGLDNVRELYALCLDFDHGETIEATRKRLGEFYGLIHTTRKHTPGAHRFRVVLPLSRPVSPFEFDALWRRFASVAGSVDQAPKDPSRFWFLPGCDDDAEFLVEGLDGKPLDVDTWLRKPDPSRYQAPPPRPPERQSDTIERAVKYIAKMPGAISGSGGHTATFNVARKLADFGLSEDEIFAVLVHDYNPRCEPPWSSKELRHKASEAHSKRTPRPVEDRHSDDFLTHKSRKPYPDEPEYQEPTERIAGDDSEEISREQSAPKKASERYPVASVKTMLCEVFEDANREGHERGLTTGVADIDDQIGGYRAGNVTLLAAMTSWGKSSWGVMALDENEPRGERVLVISGEDKRLLWGRRLACRRGDFNALLMRDGQLKPKDIARLGKMADDASDQVVFMDAIGMKAEDMAIAIRDLCSECGFKLVVADYIQRIRSRRNLERRHEVTEVTELLSNSIKIANASGLLLSQLKRTEGREPTMDDVKESGDVENMAEHVILGWKRERAGESPERLAKVAKNKDGPAVASWLPLKFDERTANFRTMTKDEGFDGYEPPYADNFAPSDGWDDMND